MKLMHAIVQGRVQGVGFRAATLRRGHALGLRGWVRNRADGTVEVLAAGSGDRLGDLEAFLRAGPQMSQVTAVEISWLDEQPGAPATAAEIGPFHIL